MNANRWKRWLITFMILFLLVIMGITMGGRERITFVENLIGNVLVPVQKAVGFVGNGIANGVRPVTKIWEMDDEIKALKEENEAYKKQIVELSLSQRELDDLYRLRKELNIIDNRIDVDDYVTCNVVAKDNGNWFNMFTIDVGSDDGITKNSPVINGDGLVGRVYEVGTTWAKVVTIIDYKSEIGFETVDSKNSYDGILRGSVESVIKGHLFDSHAVVKEGATVITAGMGIYPKGIVLGKITEVIQDPDSLLTEIVVMPMVNFKNLDKVMVLKIKEEYPDEY